MADIKITSLDKSYGTVHVLKNINLDIKSGEFIVFVGPSGCGKSTLLRTISGLETISGGTLGDRRASGQRCGTVKARHCHGVPILRALPAYDGL